MLDQKYSGLVFYVFEYLYKKANELVKGSERFYA